MARKIFITTEDRRRLLEMIGEAARSGYRGSPYLANLRSELNRAEVVDSKDVPSDVITMNSRLELLDLETGEQMIFSLVYPHDSDTSPDNISVLAPIGTAVLGYRVGDVIEWEVPDGMRRLKVQQLHYQPEAAGDDL
ncbi:MAG: nucleoside diphosphate kinase regulator [Chloroflexota bacterium]